METCSQEWCSQLKAVCVLLAGLLWTCSTFAQDEPIRDIGKREFQRSCASCHGESGRGDGLMAGLLMVKPTDLTALRKRHGDEFSVSWLYRIIDGRNEMRSHGSVEMPIWGDRFRLEALQDSPLPWNIRPEVIVHGRILSLVFYLDLIQQN